MKPRGQPVSCNPLLLLQGQVQVKQRVEMPLIQHPVNESLLNHDGRSPRDGVGCPDAQRARKPSSTSAPNDEVLSNHFLTVNAVHIVKQCIYRLLYWMN